MDQIQTINFSGPDHYIDMEKFAVGKVRARSYRNPKIGEFFKEIDLSEKKSTGISKILCGLKRNGSPVPEFETDADRAYMIKNNDFMLFSAIKKYRKYHKKRYSNTVRLVELLVLDE